MNLYQTLLQPLVFNRLNADPEAVHQQLIRTCAWIDRHGDRFPAAFLKQQLRQQLTLETPQLQQQLWGLEFPNPVGLAAGFDKDGVAAGLWASFGFGFAEVGTVTAQAQPGNPRPRLFRLPLDRAAINRMGFNNQGAAAMAATLKARNTQSVPLGINLGKSKITPLEQAVEDYLSSFQLLQDWGDYFVVNVSSPNTPGLRSLQTEAQLAPILAALSQANQARKPLLVKIAPDLEWAEIAAIVDLAQKYDLAGIIATNTTIARSGLKTKIIVQTGQAVADEAGGLSGAPLQQRSTEVIRFIYQQTQGQLPIIGVGGIFTAADAWAKIAAGASLIQVYTGWVYEGPWMVRQILQGLQFRLAERGIKSLQEAIGTALT
ncbi:MAG: quinone-dependent dihydroorotate dehydrogenase [Aphanocapsa sp. GSE-SYN-MK-11-07L]|jgi:dihydroorotate dehydrogenase|nr:quinone-dependent dihydroorotate dehydrogenase [Aphanocapsa sp. GSE-SYN-MK-11-07L]